MTTTATQVQQTAVDAVKVAFKIPDHLWQTPDSGLSRILVSAALAMPGDLMEPVKAFISAHPDSIKEFGIIPEIKQSLMGRLIAERPVIDDGNFVRLWGAGFECAINTAAINPLFRKYIRFLVKLQVGYLEHHKLKLRDIIHPMCAPPSKGTKRQTLVKTDEYRIYELHCRHLRTLRYFLGDA